MSPTRTINGDAPPQIGDESPTFDLVIGMQLALGAFDSGGAWGYHEEDHPYAE